MSTVSSTYTQSSSATQTSSSSSSSNQLGGMAPDENTFLKLLVTQLQNQDPLNPADSTQFVSQLAQFSSLEQLIQISQNTGKVATAVGSTTQTGAGSTSDTSSNNTPNLTGN